MPLVGHRASLAARLLAKRESEVGVDHDVHSFPKVADEAGIVDGGGREERPAQHGLLFVRGQLEPDLGTGQRWPQRGPDDQARLVCAENAWPLFVHAQVEPGPRGIAVRLGQRFEDHPRRWRLTTGPGTDLHHEFEVMTCANPIPAGARRTNSRAADKAQSAMELLEVGVTGCPGAGLNLAPGPRTFRVVATTGHPLAGN